MEKMILNDEYIINLYNQIHDREKKDPNAWAFHDLNHVTNVTNMAIEILQSLKCDDFTIRNAELAGLLHDIGCIEGKDGHEIRSYEMAKNYLEKKDIDNIEPVLDAIKSHRKVESNSTILTKVLILSDKLDIKKTRITEAGKLVTGNRQYCYIEDINLEINENSLNINFVIDEKVDLEELLDYYFTKKLFNSIVEFSRSLNLKYYIKINNELLTI